MLRRRSKGNGSPSRPSRRSHALTWAAPSPSAPATTSSSTRPTPVRKSRRSAPHLRLPGAPPAPGPPRAALTPPPPAAGTKAPPLGAAPPPAAAAPPASTPLGIPRFAEVRANVAAGLRPSLDEGLDWLQAHGY